MGKQYFYIFTYSYPTMKDICHVSPQKGVALDHHGRIHGLIYELHTSLFRIFV